MTRMAGARPGRWASNPATHPLGLVEKTDDRRIGLQPDQLANQSVLLGRQIQPEATVDLLGGGPVADVVHGVPPWLRATVQCSRRRCQAVPPPVWRSRLQRYAAMETLRWRGPGCCLISFVHWPRGFRWPAGDAPRRRSWTRQQRAWSVDLPPYGALSHDARARRAGGGVDWATICTRLRFDSNDQDAWDALEARVRTWALERLRGLGSEIVEDAIADMCASVVMDLAGRARAGHVQGLRHGKVPERGEGCVSVGRGGAGLTGPGDRAAGHVVRDRRRSTLRGARRAASNVCRSATAGPSSCATSRRPAPSRSPASCGSARETLAGSSSTASTACASVPRRRSGR